MKIKQQANCSIAIRSIGEDIRDEKGIIIDVIHDEKDLDDKGHPINFEFLKDTIHEVNEATGKFLLGMKHYSDGNVTTPEGELIPKGVLCSDFIEVK